MGVFFCFFSKKFFFKFWGAPGGSLVSFSVFFQKKFFLKLYWPTVTSFYLQSVVLSISFSTDYCPNIF